MAKTPAARSGVPALKDNNALPVPADLMGSMMEDAGAGVSTDPNEVGIPFLYILQDLSPQVKRRDDAYVEGAEVGDIYNNVTKEVIPASVGIDFINVGMEAAQVEWRPDRGGFAGKHPNDTPLRGQVKMTQVKDKMLPLLPNGNILTETKYHYGFYKKTGSDDAWEPCVIGMASSMIKCSRDWVGMMKRKKLPNGAIAPSFSTVYHLATNLVNKNNNEWFVWTIEDNRWVSGEEYAAGRELATQVAAGAVKTSNPGDDAPVGDRDREEEVI